MKEKALRIMKRALGSEEIAGALSRAGRDVELWRERSFEVVLKDAWVSGTFDRVEVERGEDGAVVRARILDYKTDSVKTDEEIAARAERYRSQITTYRNALSLILGIPVSSIDAALLFTRPGRMIAL